MICLIRWGAISITFEWKHFQRFLDFLNSRDTCPSLYYPYLYRIYIHIDILIDMDIDTER